MSGQQFYDFFNPDKAPDCLHTLSVFRGCSSQSDDWTYEICFDSINKPDSTVTIYDKVTMKQTSYLASPTEASELTKFCQQRTKIKPDSVKKSILRSMKRFYATLFKRNNTHILRKRYSNCTTNQLHEGLRNTLELVIPQHLVDDNLIYFTMGIINLRKVSKLPCSSEIKTEILNFLEPTRVFSHTKLQKALQSVSFRILCKYFIRNCNDPKTSFLIEALKEFPE
ncbi:unnamed protein product [Moneuplotes crassus]|uniref:Uncharacterized protein n=1 Tax=Euplotes crassus TaxID=5936 RepID=A0AAD2DCN2_EUPCR|nr:unnamed protein product [Moneuplotes crassus]